MLKLHSPLFGSRFPHGQMRPSVPPRGLLPFRLGGQPHAGPFAEGHGIVPRDAGDGMILLRLHIALRPARVRPVGAFDFLPLRPGLAPRRALLLGRGLVIRFAATNAANCATVTGTRAMRYSGRYSVCCGVSSS